MMSFRPKISSGLSGFLPLILCSLLAGCGTGSDRVKTVPVSGIVTFDGQPVPYGTLMFVPVGGGPTSIGNLKPDGTFEAGTYDVADGIPPGEYQVTFQGSMTIPVDPDQPLLPEDVPAKSPKADQKIPDRYGVQDTSDLTATIGANSPNQLKFELVP